MPTPLIIDSIEAAVDHVLDTIPGDIVLGIPLAVGKPNPFVNALYRRIKANPARKLRIITALSLLKPVGKSALEQHFLDPLVARVFGENTVLDNMAIAIESREAAKTANPLRSLAVARPSALLDECRSILEQVGLGSRLNERASVLAYGERKRLELAMTLALKPRMLLLDEPMAGMSPGDRVAAVELLRKISRELSMSILLTEHDMSVVFALADRVTVLNYGKVIASGTPEEVKASPLVREVYLGH